MEWIAEGVASIFVSAAGGYQQGISCALRGSTGVSEVDEPTTIYRERLLTNADLAGKDADHDAWLRSIGIDPSRCTVELTSGKLLIVDPIFLADVYNLNGSRERYLKESGVLLTDFGGDVSGPVFRTRCGGIKVVLAFDRVGDQGRPVFRAEGTAEAGECEINSGNWYGRHRVPGCRLPQTPHCAGGMLRLGQGPAVRRCDLPDACPCQLVICRAGWETRQHGRCWQNPLGAQSAATQDLAALSDRRSRHRR